MTNNILVTGGAGYIGSHACKALQHAGYLPVTFDNLCTGWQDAVKFGPFEQGDLMNRSDIDHVFEKYAPVAVMHFVTEPAEGVGFIEDLASGAVSKESFKNWLEQGSTKIR